MKWWIVGIMALCILPAVAAEDIPALTGTATIPPLAGTVEIPELTGTGTGTAETRFIAGWYSTDGATIPALATQYSSLFGDSSPRTTETDILVSATMYYNVTNFQVVANVAACGSLGVGEQFTIVLRKNQVATSLTGVCLSTAAAGSFTVDTDIVALVPGDTLSISFTSTATLLGRSIRVGVSLEGFKSVPVSVVIVTEASNTEFVTEETEIEFTTDPWIDMVNEILEAITAFLPLIIAFAFLVVGEWKRDYLYRAISGVFFCLFSLVGPFDYWWARIMILIVGIYLVSHKLLADTIQRRNET